MTRRYPPGPLNLLAPLGLTWRHYLHLWRNPALYASQIAHRHGNLSFLRMFGVRFYLVNHPELIAQVLVKERKSFRKLPRQTRVVRQILGNGILVSEGEFWLRQRRLVQKAFGPQQILACSGDMVALASAMLGRWASKLEVDICDEMMRLTMEITTKAFFGSHLNRQADVLAAANRELSKALTREMYALFTLPDWFPVPSKFRKRRALNEFRGEVMDLIRQRRQSASDHGDLLSALLLAVDDQGDQRGMTDQQAADELLTIFIAGHHTTSVALSWTLYLLAKHPEIESRVRNETQCVLGDRLPTLNDVLRLPYTEMVIKESLRLHPPAFALFTRQAVADVQLARYRIRKGSWIYICPFVTHRDPRFFEDPMKFDPERFSSDRIHRIRAHSYFPFGAGPHVCVGSRFAMTELLLLIPMILRDYRLELIREDDIECEPLLANHLRGGLPVRLHRRASMNEIPPAVRRRVA